jgi:hypothetical protein
MKLEGDRMLWKRLHFEATHPSLVEGTCYSGSVANILAHMTCNASSRNVFISYNNKPETANVL